MSYIGDNRIIKIEGLLTLRKLLTLNLSRNAIKTIEKLDNL